MGTAAFADEEGARLTDMDSKSFLTSLPRGGYTAARTLGGWGTGGIVMLDFHVGRIEESLRLLYPDLDLDRAAEAQLAEEEDGAKSPLDVHDTHPRTSRDSPPGGAVRIFWAGEPDSAGIVAAQDLSMLLAQELGGARGEVRMMRGATADDVAHGGLRQGAHASVFVLECDGDGAPVFPAARLLRALNAADAGAAPLMGLSFAVLGVARSACSFSAASLGAAKFQAAHKLDARLSALGATRLVPMGSADVEIDDVAVAAVPWLRALAGALMPPPPPLRRWLGRAVPRRAAAALRAGSDGGREGEAMVVVACHPDTRDARLRAAALACALPAPADSAVVEVRGEPRRTPVAKDTQWVMDRAALEAAKGAGVTEVLLPGAAGRVLEGLVTNFFAIDADGALLTAPEGVLLGHVRALVLAACRAAGLPVRLEAPSLADAGRWRGCFLTSTVRVVQPVRELRQPLAPGAPVRVWDDLSEVHRVQEIVLGALRSEEAEL